MDLNRILQASLSRNTRKTYERALSYFRQFTRAIDWPPSPLQPITIALFIAYLHALSFSHNTICTYVSAVSYLHKLQGHGDLSDSFLVRKSLLGIKRLCPAVDVRLPITIDILHKLVKCLDELGIALYKRTLYRAMFIVAFFAFLRIGEMTHTTCTSHNILFQNVKCARTEVIITLPTFKHSQRPHHIRLAPRRGPLCPVSAISAYFRVRGNVPGPLFCWPNHEPVARHQFNDMLHICLRGCGLSTDLYKGHSFRIGAATFAMHSGFSDAQIRHLGRWRSDAFKQYIRG